jgi:hypothetical protein
MKHFRLLFLTVALVSLMLLTASLSNLQLQPGTPFPGSRNSEDATQSGPSLPPIQTYSFPVLQGILALISIILVLYVSARLVAFTFVNIKKVLPFVLAIIVLLIIVYLLPGVTPNPATNLAGEYSEVPTPASTDFPVVPLGEPPQLLIQFVIVGIVSGGGLIAIMMMKRRLAPTKIEDELLQDAEEAVKALQDGMNFENAIIRCYLQMTHSIQKERGLERNYSMTVQEFEHWLVGIGFPTIPLQQLTSLFEKVRYGKQQINSLDEQIAIQSLNEIIKFCQIKQV